MNFQKGTENLSYLHFIHFSESVILANGKRCIWQKTISPWRFFTLSSDMFKASASGWPRSPKSITNSQLQGSWKRFKIILALIKSKEEDDTVDIQGELFWITRRLRKKRSVKGIGKKNKKYKRKKIGCKTSRRFENGNLQKKKSTSDKKLQKQKLFCKKCQTGNQPSTFHL